MKKHFIAIVLKDLIVIMGEVALVEALVVLVEALVALVEALALKTLEVTIMHEIQVFLLRKVKEKVRTAEDQVAELSTATKICIERRIHQILGEIEVNVQYVSQFSTGLMIALITLKDRPRMQLRNLMLNCLKNNIHEC